MLYLFQITLYSAVLFIVYLLVLKNRAGHALSRAYLLLCAALPLIIPFIKIPALYNSFPVKTSIVNVLLPEVVVNANTRPQLPAANNWPSVITMVYFSILAASLLFTIIQYTRFRRFLSGRQHKVIDGIKVFADTHAGPGSFSNYIFLPGNDIDPQIFKHEQAHIKLRHSRDIIFIRLLQCICWPNVVLYIILKELRIVHEFQADAYGASNKDTYIRTLLNDAFNTNQFSLSHTFFYHPMKRRITMLQKTPLKGKKLLAAKLATGAASIMLLTGIVYLQSCNANRHNHSSATAQTAPHAQSKEISKAEYDRYRDSMNKSGAVQLNAQQAAIAKTQIEKAGIDTEIVGEKMKNQAGQTDGKAYNSVDQMPEPKVDLGTFLSANLKYPDAARKKGIEGRVIVKFVVDKTGQVTDPQILRSPDTTLSVAALDVVNKMPKWKPGKQDGKRVPVYFTLPIAFRLQ